MYWFRGEKILSWSLMEVKELPSLVSKFFNYQSQLSRLSIYLCKGDLDPHVWVRISLLTYVHVTLLSLDYKLYCYSLASSMSGIFSIFLNKLSNVDLLQVPRTLNNFVLSILIFLYLKKYKARVIRVMIWITYLVDKKNNNELFWNIPASCIKCSCIKYWVTHIFNFFYKLLFIPKIM